MATLAQLKDRVFRSTGHKYTDTYHMTDLINDALNVMVDGAKLKGKQTISVLADDNDYALPADFKAPGLLLDETNPNAVVTYPLVSIGENLPGYAIENGYIYLKPKPNTATTLTHYYYKYATVLDSDDDVPEIDTQYHNVLADYAASMIMLLPELGFDKGTADRYKANWENGLRSFIAAMSKKNRLSRVVESVVW